MTWCEAKFQSFNDKLKLDAARRVRIDGAIGRLRDYCAADDELNAAQDQPLFLQGSVAARTVIKPYVNVEFDVDLIYPFDLTRFNLAMSATEILDWFVGRLQRSDFYQPRLIAKDRCVRIDYAGDFHLDVTPGTRALQNHFPYAIPAREENIWLTSDPIGFVDWIRGIDARSGGIDAEGAGRFIRSVRYMKRWRDASYSPEPGPSSILLTTMLGKHDPSVKNYHPALQDSLFPQYETDAAYLYDMLRLTHSCIQLGRNSAFQHPTILAEDLGRAVSQADVDDFLERLQACISHLAAAIYEQADDPSVEQYREAFGGTFPAA
jgi:hypothetical protein